MTRPDPHASYREPVSSEAEAVEEKTTPFHPDKNMPGCMMPDGGECCAGHAAVVEDWHKLRVQLATARKALESVKQSGANSARTRKGPMEDVVIAGIVWDEVIAALNSGEQKQIEDWPYPEGNPTCAQDLK